MLNGVLELHGGRRNGGIDDAEAFCADIIRRNKRTRNHYEYEEALSFLCETAWELEQTFVPKAGVSFSTYAGYVLRQRLVDYDARISRRRLKWKFKDRVYERPPVRVESLDQVGIPEPAGGMDGPEPGAADFVGVLRARAGTEAREDVDVGEGSYGEAA